MKRIAKQLLLLFFVLLMSVPVLAQDAAKVYEVIGNKPVNARSCPHVSCPVVQSVQPGETVMVVDTVTGDNTLGSDQWYKVESNGDTMYIHSALIQASTTPNTAAASSKVNTSDWVTYKGKGYSFSAPADWLDFYALMEDPDYREAIAEMQNVKPAEIKANWEDYKKNGLVAKLTVGNSITLELEKISMKDWVEKPTLQFWKPAFKASLKEIGATASSAEIIALPLGDCLHIHAQQTRNIQGAPKGTLYIMYVTTTADYLYTLTIYTTKSAFAKVDPVADAIAQSFTLIRGNANA